MLFTNIEFAKITIFPNILSLRPIFINEGKMEIHLCVIKLSRLIREDQPAFLNLVRVSAQSN